MYTPRTWGLAVVLAAVILARCDVGPSNVWRVDACSPAGEEAQDGLTWETAFDTIQEGLDAAAAKCGANGVACEVWIAGGTYTGVGANVEVDQGHYGVFVEECVVALRDDVHVYGGFAGNEIRRGARDILAHATIIDGEETRRCVFAEDIPAGGATLDGITLTNGQAFRGGGLYNLNASPKVVHCAFTLNYSTYSGGALSSSQGGGVYNIDGANPAISGCTFTGNNAFLGGAVYNGEGTAPVLSQCVFTENVGSYGGAMTNDGASCTPELSGCAFAGNSGSQSAGAILSMQASSLRVVNSVFIRNTSKFGGAIATDSSATLDAINCSFFGNTVSLTGGAIWNGSAVAELTNCILWGDSSEASADVPFPADPEVHNDGETPCVITYSCIQGGYDGEGNIDTDPLYADPEADDLHLASGSPCIDAGTSEGAPDSDFDGAPRPVGAGIDIGAFESDMTDTRR